MASNPVRRSPSDGGRAAVEGAGFETLGQLESVARQKVGPRVWGYIQGGAGDERTLEANRRAFLRRSLLPRAFVDVSRIDLGTHVLGHSLSAPFYVAPTAYQGLVHPGGECAMARAASSEGILAMFSTLSSSSIEEIAACAPKGPRWFQLYLQPDSSLTLNLVGRAESSGCTALVLTADVPVLGVRDRQLESGFALDETIPLGNGPGVVPPPRGPSVGPEGRYVLRNDAADGWDVLDWLRAHTNLPIVVKGLLTASDARLAVDHGARAVIVSNHGGRQLDGAPAALDALPEVVREVEGDAEVYFDSGVRRGADVLIALALGARAVGLGRPALWALAAGGEAGVARLLALLKVELANEMAQCGRRSISEVDRFLLGDFATPA